MDRSCLLRLNKQHYCLSLSPHIHNELDHFRWIVPPPKPMLGLSSAFRFECIESMSYICCSGITNVVDTLYMTIEFTSNSSIALHPNHGPLRCSSFSFSSVVLQENCPFHLTVHTWVNIRTKSTYRTITVSPLLRPGDFGDYDGK